METLNIAMDFIGFAAGIIAAVFVYSAYQYGPNLYRKPLMKFFTGLLFLSFAFAIPPLRFILTTVHGGQFDFLHHFLLIVSVFFFVLGAREFFRIGR